MMVIVVSPTEMTAQQTYRWFVKDLLSPTLRKLGFKGSSGKYTLHSDLCWAFLTLQGSKWNTATDVEFTINLKVVSKAAWQAALDSHGPGLGEVPPANGPDIDIFDLDNLDAAEATERLACIAPGAAGDRWWRVGSSTSPEEILADLSAMVRDYGVPWLNTQAARLAVSGEPANP